MEELEVVSEHLRTSALQIKPEGRAYTPYEPEMEAAAFDATVSIFVTFPVGNVLKRSLL